MIQTLGQLFEGFNEDALSSPLIHNNDATLGLLNPQSHATSLLVYLASLDLGSPSLFQGANRAAREKDLSQLEILGPFIRALNACVQNAEFSK